MPSFWAALRAVLWKDLSVEWRSRQLLGAMFAFAVLVILIFNFSLELDAAARRTVASGVLWSTYALAGTLGLNRSFGLEREGGALDGLLLAPIDRGAIFFGKLLANLLFLLILAIFTLPLYALLYNVNVFMPGLLLVLLLGALGYVTVGTLLAAMASAARTRDLLLPVLLFPMVIPVLITAVRASSGFLSGLEMQYIWPSLNVLIAYDLIMLATAYMVFDFVLEE